MVAFELAAKMGALFEAEIVSHGFDGFGLG